MSSTDPTPDEETRTERIEKLLLIIAGVEVSIRDAQELRDYEFLKILKGLKPKYYEKLRRLAYGLPEDRKLPTKDQS